jgi:fucokinase
MASTGEIRDLFEKNALRCVRDMVLAGSVCEPDFEVFPLALKNETEVCLPLRINWGGTWTDTPPYCLENGGAVVNAAVLINASKLPGGISISAGVVGIPKGSGLGTSSILLAACIKGLFEFFGQPLSFASLCRRVLLAEQLMGTGGGWQDQAGGLVPGIKLAVSAPNFRQEVVCHRLTPPPAFLAQLTESFCIDYRGQRRVGRTILREIMRGYIQSDPLYLRTLKDIRTLADETKTAVSSGDFFGFIDCLNRQTALTTALDAGYTNARIDAIFESCADITAGKMICGAGGGGFMQIILKPGVSRDTLRSRLKTAFPDQNMDVWNCAFV